MYSTQIWSDNNGTHLAPVLPRRQESLHDDQSPAIEVDVGVPQGSVLGPLLFVVYCSPVADAIADHDVQYHQYASVMQLHHTMHANNSSAGLSVLTKCTADIKQWYLRNGLQLNLDKSED